MADTNLPVTPGSGTNVDGQTIDNGNFRQTIVIGDPTTTTKVAPVDSTLGLTVKVSNFPNIQSIQSGVTPLITALTTSFRTVGLASAPHNLFTLENPIGSGRTIAILSLITQEESSALSTNLVSICTGHTTALPSGGTILAMDKLETSGTISAIARGATASDGGVATTITATLLTRMWTQFRQRFLTAVGYIANSDNYVLPSILKDRPLLLAPGTAIIVQAVSAALTTDQYVVNCMWFEY